MTDILPTRDVSPRATKFGGKFARLGNHATLTGTLEEVYQIEAWLREELREKGWLVKADPAQPTAEPGQFLINVRLVPRSQPHAARQPQPRRKLPRWALWSIAGGVLTLLTGIGLGIVAAVNIIKANLALASVVAIAVTVLVVALLGNRSTGKTFSGTFKGKIH